MPPDNSNFNETLDKAVNLHEANKFEEAETLYRELLKRDPKHPGPSYYLGVLALQTGNHESAVRVFDHVLTLKPDFPEAFYNKGNALMASENDEEALACFDKAIELREAYFEAWNNKGTLHQKFEQLPEALASFEKMISLNPKFSWSHFNKGNVELAMGRSDAAISSFKSSIELKPDAPVVFNNLGTALKYSGQFEEAIVAFDKALNLESKYAEAYSNKAATLVEIERHDEALTNFDAALKIDPDNAEYHFNKGNAFKKMIKLSAAISSFRQAITLRSTYAEAVFNLGNTMASNWQLEEAVSYLRQATKLDPNYQTAWHNLLYTMLFLPTCSEKVLFEEHRKWANSLSKSKPRRVFTNDKDKNRKLRVGYVSPDFRRHSCAYFIEPLFDGHSSDEVEIYAYSGVKLKDDTTLRLKKAADCWRDVYDLNDEEVGALIEQDKIDILVELEGHSGNSRVELFAQKMAPIQVSWLGYPATTGLSEIDYRFTDDIADPIGESDVTHSEELVRLTDGFICYKPSTRAPEIEDPPCKENGYVTFGCFNNASKINLDVIAAWAEILKAVPDSKLILKSDNYKYPETREIFLEAFSDHSIEAHRLELLKWIPDDQNPITLYNQVDIALDTYPYNGTTTTFEALWMGCPVIAIEGDSHRARVGTSILKRLGLDELLAEDTEAYIEIAKSLAGDKEKISEYRTTLRPKMAESNLLNASLFAQNVEEAYRTMWQKSCDQ